MKFLVYTVETSLCNTFIHFLRYLLNIYFEPGTGSGPGAYRDEKDLFMPLRSEGKTVIAIRQVYSWYSGGSEVTGISVSLIDC